MNRVPRALAVLFLTLGLAASPAAQTSNFAPAGPDASKPRGGGWTITPTFVYSASLDDNVLIREANDQPTGDFTHVVNPRGTLSYTGRRTRLDMSYDGAFMMYREFSTLNSFDQRASAFLRHMVSKHVSLFVNETVALMPTTEFVEFVGVPFVRTGSTVQDLRGGVEIEATKRTSITASYDLNYTHFDATGDPATLLLGGHSHGGSLTWRRLVSPRTTVFATYDLQRATVTGGGSPFNVQNWVGGVEQKLSTTVRIYGAVGISRLGVNSFGPPHTGPAWRAGLTRQFEKAGVDVDYSRSLVPSYGFGGTLQNEEIVGRVRLPLTRRVSGQASVAWRSNQSLIVTEPNLHTRWIEGSIGYGFNPWLRAEVFYANSQQNIDRPGGLVERNRIGVQVITSNPLRVR